MIGLDITLAFLGLVIASKVFDWIGYAGWCQLPRKGRAKSAAFFFCAGGEGTMRTGAVRPCDPRWLWRRIGNAWSLRPRTVQCEPASIGQPATHSIVPGLWV
jgi:hypothetical protein